MKFTQMLAMVLLILAIAAVAPQAASGEVIYTAVNKTLSGSGSMGLDLDQNGIRDFTLVAASHATVCGLLVPAHAGSVYIKVAGNVPVVTHGNYAALLQTDIPIKFDKSYAIDQFYVCFGHNHHVDGYLGLKFQISGQTHYGWAQISVDASPTSTRTTLIGFAYETIPNQAINTGQISGSAAQ
jgi:hypothetical protein